MMTSYKPSLTIWVIVLDIFYNALQGDYWLNKDDDICLLIDHKRVSEWTIESGFTQTILYQNNSHVKRLYTALINLPLILDFIYRISPQASTKS